MEIKEVKSLLAKNWGVDGDLSPLPSERDINFKVDEFAWNRVEADKLSRTK